MTGWRPALRIAWRDALRHRARSALVLVMVALPVLAVTAAAVVLNTSEVSGVERADRLMGAADALVRAEAMGPVVQAPDPETAYSALGTVEADPATEEQLRGVLGPDTRLVPIRRGWGGVRIDERVVNLEVTGVDLGDPLAAGLFELTEGRLPAGPHEVVANEALLAKGLAVGDTVALAAGETTIVGAGRDATHREAPVVVGPVTAVEGETIDTETWLVGAGPVHWSQVRALNELGAVVTSRAVLADPPDVAELAEELGYDTGTDELFAVAVLIVVMALLEVVLLAGPAFAVGARRQARALALIAASGGTPAQARRVVLAGGVVLGTVASAAGVVLGVLVGWALLPAAQRYDASWFGPTEVPVGWLAAIAAFGVVSAFLAAVVPAWIASRQDVVAVLAGRRGDRRPRAATPVLGLVLLGAGVAGSAYGSVTAASSSGALWIAASAVVSVLGMILVVPVVVTAVARLGRRFPLTPRYAVRDAARHRTRTVPAVAAVAATVAGVVALGIANASNERENEQTYQPEMTMGTGRVTWSPTVLPGEDLPDPESVWDRLESAVHEVAPAVETRRVTAVVESRPDGGYTGRTFSLPGDAPDPLLLAFSGGFGASVLVGEDARAAGLPEQLAGDEVDAALAAGRAVVFAQGRVASETVRIVTERMSPDGTREGPVSRAVVPATFVDTGDTMPPAVAVLPPVLAERLDAEAYTAGLLLQGELDAATQTRITEVAAGVTQDSAVYVERGYVRPDDAFIILLVLGVLGAVLMLGGTLTATFLALSDARPDLATLSAVGASPRTRRRIAASYALVVGSVGALLGAAVGFIPGVAISRPLTALSPGGPYLAVPWPLIAALVVALPLLTAAVVGLTARARLPLVARLD